MQHPSELLSIAIVDENIFWCRRTRKYLCSLYPKHPPDVELYTDGEAFLAANRYFDIVFLDCKIGNQDGFEVAQIYKIRAESSQVIFLTDHEELCRKGYQVGAFRFIPKELMEEEVPEALHAVRRIKQKEEHIIVSILGRGPTLLTVNEIIYAQMESRHLRIHTRTGDHLCNMSVTKLEEMLEGYFGFFRSHRACLVNLNEIATFDNFGINMKDRSRAYLSTHKIRPLRVVLREYQFKAKEIKGNERSV